MYSLPLHPCPHRLLALAAAMTLLHVPVTAAGEIEEVIVTAQKREQRLEDVPITVTALTGESLAAANVTDLADIADVTPGLSFESIGLRSPFIFMRGAGTGAFDIGSDPSVGVFVDEVYQPRFTGMQLDLLDVERIEVMKGPQVALFGRNTLGGAIQVVTRKPTPTLEGLVSAHIGAPDLAQFAGTLSGPIAGERLLGRLTVAHKSRDGWVENVLTGVKHHDVDAQAARGQLLWNGDLAQLRVILDYSRDDANAAPFSNETSSVLLLSPTSPYFGLVPSTFDKERQYFNTDGFQDRESRAATATLDVDLGWADLTATTAFLAHDFVESHDFDATQAAVIDRFADEESDSFSLEVRLAGEMSADRAPLEGLNWLVGLYYFDDDASRYERFTFGPDNLLSAFFAGGNTVFINDSHRVQTEAWALFGQAGLQLAEAFRLNLGMRYSEDEKSSKRDALPSAFTPFLPAPYSIDLARDWTSFDPQVSLQFTPAPDLSLYVSYAEGFKSGGFQPSVPATPLDAQEIFDPEEVTSYELGIKSIWLERRLRFNAAAFRAEYDNLQFVAATGVRPGGAPIVVITNAASSITEGVEIELMARPVEALELGLGYAYLDATFDEYVDGNGVDQSGHRIERTPEHQGHLTALYRIPVSVGTLSVAGEVKSQSRTFFDPDNIVHQDGYTTFNASIALDSSDGRWQISLWGRNLGDDDHCANIISLSESQVALCSLDALRTYGISLAYHL